MARTIAGLITLVLLGSCGVGLGRTAPDSAVVVPEARGVAITPLGRGAWQISYQAPGAPASWYAELGRRLEARGWRSADLPAYAPLNRSYSRATPLGVAEVWEWAFFSVDPLRPELAQVRVQRAIDVPVWRRLRRLVSAGLRGIASLASAPG